MAAYFRDYHAIVRAKLTLFIDRHQRTHPLTNNVPSIGVNFVNLLQDLHAQMFRAGIVVVVS